MRMLLKSQEKVRVNLCILCEVYYELVNSLDTLKYLNNKNKLFCCCVKRKLKIIIKCQKGKNVKLIFINLNYGELTIIINSVK